MIVPRIEDGDRHGRAHHSRNTAAFHCCCGARNMLKTNPFLHIDAERIYDPLTDRALVPGDGGYERFRAFQTRARRTKCSSGKVGGQQWGRSFAPASPQDRLSRDADDLQSEVLLLPRLHRAARGLRDAGCALRPDRRGAEDLPPHARERVPAELQRADARSPLPRPDPHAHRERSPGRGAQQRLGIHAREDGCDPGDGIAALSLHQPVDARSRAVSRRIAARTICRSWCAISIT